MTATDTLNNLAGATVFVEHIDYEDNGPRRMRFDRTVTVHKLDTDDVLAGRTSWRVVNCRQAGDVAEHGVCNVAGHVLLGHVAVTYRPAVELDDAARGRIAARRADRKANG